MRSPNTTGELREYLSCTMEDVRSGQLDIQKGLAVAKIASQITASLVAEAQLAAMDRISKGRTALGVVPLGEPVEEAVEHAGRLRAITNGVRTK